MIRASNNPYQSTPAIVYPNLFKGNFPSLEALELAHPEPEPGSRANIIVIDGPNDLASWDTDDSGWVIYPGEGIDLSGYYTKAEVDAALSVKFNSSSTTDALSEGSSNLYFQTARVLATVLTGISFATGSAITAADTVLQAFGKIQKQINDLSTIYQVALTATNFGAFINGLTGKTTPVDADSISLVDSADSNKQKKVSLTNFKAFLKTYFDTLYVQRQGLYFYHTTSTVTFTSDQKNMHFSRFTSSSPYGTYGLTLGNGIPETSLVVDMSYMGDTCVPLIVPYNCIVEEIIIRYSRNISESSGNSNLMIRMMSDTRYQVDNQMICDYNLVGTTHIANEEVSVSITPLSHSTINKGGGLKFCVRTNNATAQQYNIFRILVIIKKV